MPNRRLEVLMATGAVATLAGGLLVTVAGTGNAAPALLSQGKPTTASSEGGADYAAKNAVDGSTTTRWASVRNVDPQWIKVDLGAANSISEVKLVWDLSCATSYKVEFSTDNSTWKSVYSTTTGDGGTDDLTVSGSARYVRMTGSARCRPTMGYSLQEFQVYGGSGGDTQAPTAPQNLRSTGSTATSVALAWDAATDNVGVAAYDIYHDGNKIAEAAGTSTSKNVTGLKANTQYRFTVFARDAAGNVSQASTMLPVTTPPSSDTTKPTAPTGLAVTGTTSSTASLKWNASTDDVGVTGYDVYNGTTVILPDAKGTSATVTGLAADSSYQLTVRAKDAAGNVSDPSNQVTAKTLPDSSGDKVPSSIKTISSGWSIPWGLGWLPDGSALITERDSFKLFKLTQSGTRTQVGKVPNVVTTNGEGGLLGIAVSPNWADDHFIYLYHTSSSDNRIVRMTYDGSALGGYKVLLTGIKKSTFHNGGRLKFGPDGYLYATVGEAQTPNLAQDKNSLNGKILRMTADGKPAPGNPFGNYVYSYGHRNPQGLAWDPQGRLWSAEFGNSKYDELNLIEPGKNYGWPICEGNCSTSGMTNPKKQWAVSQASPSGLAYSDGALYMAALRGQRLWRIPVSGTTAGTPTAYYVNAYGRLRTVEKVPGKSSLWLTTTNADNNGGQPDGSDKAFQIDLK
ncbi:PQQ-dependent sugar dehydrogenase [Wenjunlia tyrosinilytica]|uniref:Oxidoreductase n=1 Tax=Wenjunlia tyrosinilytica TaxID=1544741 RepID=A0A917ZRS0_9ACTN|nr:PQQ-dependent sugar dehydrogenase [Wenjunlia tyrosinilytica]GGO88748.1 oxidoreductase [Wenjunlia tyrosinilytica]